MHSSFFGTLFAGYEPGRDGFEASHGCGYGNKVTGVKLMDHRNCVRTAKLPEKLKRSGLEIRGQGHLLSHHARDHPHDIHHIHHAITIPLEKKD